MSNIDDLLTSVNSFKVPEAAKITSNVDTQGIRIEYKTDQRTSLFIPSQIEEQLHNVIENISRFEKKKGGRESDVDLKTIRLDDVFDEKEAKMTESIVGGGEIMEPRLNNFMGESRKYEIKVNEVEKEGKKEQRYGGTVKEDVVVDRLLEILETDKRNFIAGHEDKLKRVY